MIIKDRRVKYLQRRVMQRFEPLQDLIENYEEFIKAIKSTNTMDEILEFHQLKHLAYLLNYQRSIEEQLKVYGLSLKDFKEYLDKQKEIRSIEIETSEKSKALKEQEERAKQSIPEELREKYSKAYADVENPEDAYLMRFLTATAELYAENGDLEDIEDDSEEIEEFQYEEDNYNIDEDELMEEAIVFEEASEDTECEEYAAYYDDEERNRELGDDEEDLNISNYREEILQEIESVPDEVIFETDIDFLGVVDYDFDCELAPIENEEDEQDTSDYSYQDSEEYAEYEENGLSAEINERETEVFEEIYDDEPEEVPEELSYILSDATDEDEVSEYSSYYEYDDEYSDYEEEYDDYEEEVEEQFEYESSYEMSDDGIDEDDPYDYGDINPEEPEIDEDDPFEYEDDSSYTESSQYNESDESYEEDEDDPFAYEDDSEEDYSEIPLLNDDGDDPFAVEEGNVGIVYSDTEEDPDDPFAYDDDSEDDPFEYEEESEESNEDSFVFDEEDPDDPFYYDENEQESSGEALIFDEDGEETDDWNFEAVDEVYKSNVGLYAGDKLQDSRTPQEVLLGQQRQKKKRPLSEETIFLQRQQRNEEADERAEKAQEALNLAIKMVEAPKKLASLFGSKRNKNR